MPVERVEKTGLTMMAPIQLEFELHYQGKPSLTEYTSHPLDTLLTHKS